MPAVVLMYHDLGTDVQSVTREHLPYVLSVATFRRQLEQVRAVGLPMLKVNEWCSTVKPSRAVVMTFDDGDISNYTLALPMLQEFGFKATFFVTAGFIGQPGTMSWQQIRALHEAGMEIGSHTLTHRPPSTLTAGELRYELTESRRTLEDGLGAAVTSISSPTGFFNPRMREIAKEVGYRAVCFGRIGLAPDRGDSFSLNRVAVKRMINEKQFDDLLKFNQHTIAILRMQQAIRDLARHWLGVGGYLRARSILLRLSGVNSGLSRTP
jgi:peptidoglycan/xylan/chitin deacetylase (PgdA/CDA1 family)